MTSQRNVFVPSSFELVKIPLNRVQMFENTAQCVYVKILRIDLLIWLVLEIYDVLVFDHAITGLYTSDRECENRRIVGICATIRNRAIIELGRTVVGPILLYGK